MCDVPLAPPGLPGKYDMNFPRFPIAIAGRLSRCASEILFIDPSVSDLRTVLGNLRPEVHAIVLDERWPAARQMAAALNGREGLDAVHVIAHGAPGRVRFASGEWSSETLVDEADDLAAIGRALGADGELRLWSCDTGTGAAGTAFVAGLTEATGADVAAATTRVGSAALGGAWELSVRARAAAARPPLIASGLVSYQGILLNDYVTVSGTTGTGTGDLTAGTTYYILSGGEVVGEFSLPTGNGRTFSLNVEVSVAGPYTYINQAGTTISGY